MISRLFYFVVLALMIVSCARQPITGAEYLTNELPAGKIAVIDISDELRFDSETEMLSVGDSLNEASPALDKIIDVLMRNGDARAEVKVSHVYRSKQYREEGLEKSRKLKEYFIEQGIEPSRIRHKTFLDRRSKYPHTSPFRKVLVVLTNIKHGK